MWIGQPFGLRRRPDTNTFYAGDDEAKRAPSQVKQKKKPQSDRSQRVKVKSHATAQTDTSVQFYWSDKRLMLSNKEGRIHLKHTNTVDNTERGSKWVCVRRHGPDSCWLSGTINSGCALSMRNELHKWKLGESSETIWGHSQSQWCSKQDWEKPRTCLNKSTVKGAVSFRHWIKINNRHFIYCWFNDIY